MRGATVQCADRRHAIQTFQSTHPMRGATFRSRRFTLRILHFNPRTPCGVRQKENIPACLKSLFQSTHPMRGATGKHAWNWPSRRNFNPRTPCGVRRLPDLRVLTSPYFNPRTPCGVRPPYLIRRRQHRGHFNPRTPCGVRRSIVKRL